MMDNVLKMQIDKAVPAGYKLTEMGVIPEDWDMYTFNDLIESCSSGATPYRGNKSFYTGSNKWITSGELNYCVINDTLEKISDEAVKRSNLKIHPAGTFLMAITGMEAAGTRGACGIVGQSAATNQSCMAIYPNHKLSSLYLYHWYVYNGESLAFKYCQGTKQLSYTAGLLRTIPIYIPRTIKEQTRIANVLSDTDALITKLEQLIAKKQTIKSATMQQLLTGRTRLPQFSKHPDGTSKSYKASELGSIPEDWKVLSVGQVCDLLTGFPFSSNKYSDSGIRLLRGSNVKRGITDWSDGITQYWPEISADIKQYELYAGDIVISMDGSLVGRSFAQLSDSDLPAVLLQRVARVRTSFVDQGFLKEWICSQFFTEHCDAVKTVTAIPHISPQDIRSFKFLMPPTNEEQTAIANILSDMDAELTALEQKLAKVRDIKQGMMQQLLTGRIRLPLDQQP